MTEGTADRAAVLKAFLAPDGRLVRVPAKRSKRLVVLDLLAQEFAPGETFTEDEVNRRLRRFHDDVGSLRRYVVDVVFLSRQHGWYWRSGGAFEV